MVQFLSRSWQARLAELLTDCAQSLLLATPFIKRDAAQWVLDTVNRRRRRSINTTIMTAISPESVLGASLDLDALLLFADTFEAARIIDVHRLHAKVYGADQRQVIVTSGNLTSPAFGANYEYGILVSDPTMVNIVYSDMEDYARAGREVTQHEIVRLHKASRDVLAEYGRAPDSVDSARRRELTEEWNEITASFGAPPGLHQTGSARFKGPIVEVLLSRGPLTTKDLCDAIQASWPYLCDDSVMRVARDGSRKRQWRHDVHTAQETLQRAGALRRDRAGRWLVQGGNRT